MIINETSNDKLAICYTHLAYRNTDLEDFHAKGDKLGKRLYNRMYKIVSSNFERIKKYKQKLIDIKSIEEMKDFIKNADSSQKEFVDFIADMAFNSQMGYGWDNPVEIQIEQEINDVAAFVLAGKFMECCEKQLALSDDIMCYINKDICNRIFTLLQNNYI